MKEFLILLFWVATVANCCYLLSLTRQVKDLRQDNQILHSKITEIGKYLDSSVELPHGGGGSAGMIMPGVCGK